MIWWWWWLLLLANLYNAVSHVVIGHILDPDSSSHSHSCVAAPAAPGAPAAAVPLVLVIMVPRVKIISICEFHHSTWKLSDDWVWIKPPCLISKQYFLWLSRIVSIPQTLHTPTLWWRPAARFLTRREAKLCEMHSSNSDQTAPVQASEWLIKMFRMFGIASHLFRSFVPRRDIFDSEVQQRRETFQHNRRGGGGGGVTAGHKACVLGVMRTEDLLCVLFELIVVFTEGEMEWNKTPQCDNCVFAHSCRIPFTVNLLKFQKLGRVCTQQ